MAAEVFENIWQLIVMLVLLFCSALLSGSETAYFNISKRQVLLLRQSHNTFAALAIRVLKNPKRLLTSLLFGNMAVNVLFFALASVLALNIGQAIGPAAGGAVACVAFVLLLLFGEMLPKSLAYSNSKQFCIWASAFCYVCIRILSPIISILDFLVVVPSLRLLGVGAGSGHATEIVTVNQFKSLIEASRHRGLISADENRLMNEVIEMSFLKVRHVMKPRVDMISCEVNDSAKDISDLMLKNRVTKIPVYSENIDNIVGLIRHRDMLLDRDEPIAKLLVAVDYLPEQKSVESLLEFFRKHAVDMAIVVDEYGGIAGGVSLENVVEELIGPMEPGEQAEPIEQIGALEYRLSGDLAIHDWAEVFGVDAGHERLSTVGGLTTALLGRIPKPGDVAYLKNLKLTVEKVRKRRIESLVLSLESKTEETD